MRRLASVPTATAFGFNSSAILPPTFLAPTLRSTIQAPLLRSQFSTSSPNHFRKRRHGNPDRGVSALRRTGLRYPIGMSNYPLPKPVLDPKRRSKVVTDEKHGLWGFFNKDKKRLTEPLREVEFGRAWSQRELRNKSWEDIHALWWVCCKERNRLATEKLERDRLKAGGGDAETQIRDKEIRRTMKAIKTVLTERWYVWEDARKIAEKDSEIDLNSDLESPAYTPKQSRARPQIVQEKKDGEEKPVSTNST